MAGLVDTVKLAGVLILAIPAALAGLEFLLVRGETLTGAVLLVLAVGLVVVQHRLPMPTDLPGIAAKRVVGSVAPETESESEPELDDEQ